MLYEIRGPKESGFMIASYQLLEPVELTIKKADGAIISAGYGIGEIFEVLEPCIQYAIPATHRKATILLTNGDMILNPPNMKVTRVIP